MNGAIGDYAAQAKTDWKAMRRVNENLEEFGEEVAEEKQKEIKLVVERKREYMEETILFERTNQPTNLAFKDSPSFQVEQRRQLYISYGYRRKVKEGVDIQFNLLTVRDDMPDQLIWRGKLDKPLANGAVTFEVDPGEYKATVSTSGNAGWDMKVYQR